MNNNLKKGIELIFSTLFPYETSFFKKMENLILFFKHLY